MAMFGSLFLVCIHTHNHFCTVHSPTFPFFKQNKLQKLPDALGETGETWETGETGETWEKGGHRADWVNSVKT